MMTESIHELASLGSLDRVRSLLEDEGADIHALDCNRCTPLHLASAAGHFEVAHLLLEKGVLVNAIDVNEETALQRASEFGHLDILNLLLRNDADINVLGMLRMSPLHYAGSNLEVLGTLLDQGADIELFDHNGLTTLHWAVKMGRVEVAAFLLDRGANIDARDHDGLTPLRYGDFHTMKLLLDRGCNVNALDCHNRTTLYYTVDKGKVDQVHLLLARDAYLEGALHRAVCQRDLELTGVLLDAGADPEELDELGWQPFHHAIQKRHPGIVRLLIARGANVDALTDDDEQQSALQLAALDGDVEMCRLLLDEGASLEERDAEGRTALMTASGGHVEVVRLLLSRGANINAVDLYRWSAVAIAADGGWFAVARLLLERGARVEAGTEEKDWDEDDGVEMDGRTPLHRAAAAGHVDMVTLLLDRGAKTDVADVHGWRPIHKAAQLNHVEVVNLLLARGANTLLRANGVYPSDLTTDKTLHRLLRDDEDRRKAIFLVKNHAGGLQLSGKAKNNLQNTAIID